jgi:hypothetical protein
MSEESSHDTCDEGTELPPDSSSVSPSWDPALFDQLLPRNDMELLSDIYKELAYLLEMSRLNNGQSSWIFVAQQKKSNELQELYDSKVSTSHAFHCGQQLKALIGTKKEFCNAFRVYREKLRKLFRVKNWKFPEEKPGRPPIQKERRSSVSNPSDSLMSSPLMHRVKRALPIASNTDSILATLPPSIPPSSPRQLNSQQKTALNELRWSTINLATTTTLQWGNNVFGSLAESCGQHMLKPEVQELAFLLEKSRLETGAISWKFVEEHDKSDGLRKLWEERAQLQSFHQQRMASLIGNRTEVRDVFDAYCMKLRKVMVSWLQNHLRPNQSQSILMACRAQPEPQRSATIPATSIESYTTALKEYHHLSSEVRKQAYINHYINQWRKWLGSDQTQSKDSFMAEQESQLRRVRLDEVTLLKSSISSEYLSGDDDWIRSARMFISLRENQWHGFCEELLRTWTDVAFDTDPGHFEHNQRDLWEYFCSAEQSMIDLHITKKKVRPVSLSSPLSQGSI